MYNITKIPNAHTTVFPITMLTLQSFFPRIVFIGLYKEPQPQMASHHRPKTPSTENPSPKNQIPDTIPKTPTRKNIITEQKQEENIKNNPGKNI